MIVATNNDAEDAFTILTARELNLILLLTSISPAVIGGQLLVRSAPGKEDIEGIANQLLEEAE